MTRKEWVAACLEVIDRVVGLDGIIAWGHLVPDEQRMLTWLLYEEGQPPVEYLRRST